MRHEPLNLLAVLWVSNVGEMEPSLAVPGCDLLNQSPRQNLYKGPEPSICRGLQPLFLSEEQENEKNNMPIKTRWLGMVGYTPLEKRKRLLLVLEMTISFCDSKMIDSLPRDKLTLRRFHGRSAPLEDCEALRP